MDYGAIIQAAIALKAQADAGKITAKQFKLLEEQLARIANIPLPDLQKITAEQLGPSAMEGIQRDESLRGDQLSALESLRDIANSGGLSLGDKAAIEGINADVNAADRRRRASILADLAGRGQLDSGAALVASLSSAQDSANRARAGGRDTARAAEARKMEALRALSQGAGALRGQDFAEATAKAQARDEINRWNASAREKSSYYNAGLAQQQFGNAMAKATGQQAGANNLASAYGNEAAGVRGQGAAAGQIASAAYNSTKGALSSSGGSNSSSGSGPIGYDNSGTPYYSNPDEWANPYPDRSNEVQGYKLSEDDEK